MIQTEAMDLSNLTRQTFEPHVGSTFKVKLPNGVETELKLAETARLMERVTSKRLKREPFGLYFHGADSLFLPQGVYEFSHPALESALAFFIVPVRHDEGIYEYEAVFT